MAWLSVGTSHEDLCQKLSQHGILSDGEINRAFRSTDRGDFVLPEDRIQAYLDRPYKREHVHISAPHMYVTVLQALELQRGQSFLNIGSGSGYLCCLVAYLIGESGLVQGVDINSAAVTHSRQCVSIWRQKLSEQPHSRHFPADCIQIVEGDVFNLDIVRQVRSGSRFDRIYVGAAVSLAQHTWFLPLLREGGLLVAPIIETHQLLQIRRIYGDVFEQHVLGNVHFAPLLFPSIAPPHVARLVHPMYAHHASSNAPHTVSFDRVANPIIDVIYGEEDDIDDDNNSNNNIINNNRHISNSNTTDSTADAKYGIKMVQTISPQHMLIYPASIPDTFDVNLNNDSSAPKWILPRDIWKPSQLIHARYPSEFKRGIYTLLLCASLCRDSKVSIQRVPVAVWWHVVSFMSRDWFTVSHREVSLLQSEVTAMKRLYQYAQRRLIEEERLRRAAERERDLLRVMVSRHQVAHNSPSSRRDASLMGQRHTVDYLRHNRGQSYFAYANDSDSDNNDNENDTDNNTNDNDNNSDNSDNDDNYSGNNSDNYNDDEHADESHSMEIDGEDQANEIENENEEEIIEMSDNETNQETNANHSRTTNRNNVESVNDNHSYDNSYIRNTNNNSDNMDNINNMSIHNDSILVGNASQNGNVTIIIQDITVSSSNSNGNNDGLDNEIETPVVSIYLHSQTENIHTEDAFVVPLVPHTHIADRPNLKRPRSDSRTFNHGNEQDHSQREQQGAELESVVSEDYTDNASFLSFASHSNNSNSNNHHNNYELLPYRTHSTSQLFRSRGNTSGDLTDDEISVSHNHVHFEQSQK